jgi:ribonuclease VapC
VVIDSSALVTVHLQEFGSEELFAKIAGAKVAIIGAPTLLETAMVLSSRLGRDSRALLAGSLRELGVQVAPFTEDHYHAAIDAFLRYGKGRHKAALNFGDCIAYAVAAVSGLPLLYTGRDFAQTDIAAA